MHMSKGDFATEIGVSAGRVSQYIAAGIIGSDALSGEGRNARIIVDVAKAQISRRRHGGQALGNGLMTRLVGPQDASPEEPEAPKPETLKRDDPATLIQIERLESERRKNRLAAIDEAREVGQLVPAEDMQCAVGRTAQQLVNAFTGMAPDIANAVAAQFSLPQRDVLHLVRKVMNEKRGGVAQAMKEAGNEMPETVEAIV